MRRHGWQRPLHPLQIVGMAVYSLLVVSFYTFIGFFLGNRVAEITVITVFSIAAVSVMLLFTRCTAIDPTDKTRLRKRRKAKSKGPPKLNYGFIMGQIILRFFRRMERKILRTFIRRKYLDPWKSTAQVEPLLLPFPLIMKNDDAITPELKEDDLSYCSLCNFEVKKHSKHCRTCNKCVEGFDHHCRWLNNCVGKKNYTTFILMMIFILLMLLLEGSTAMAIFVRCFVDKRGIEMDLKRRLCAEFPRGLLATISVLLFLLTAYSSAAMGQLLFFHMVLIQKGMRTYDYIIAMKEENQSMELDPFNDSDSSSNYSIGDDSPKKPAFTSKLTCKGQMVENQCHDPKKLSIRVEGEPEASASKKEGFRAGINPWKLIKMSKEKAVTAVEKARERLMKQKSMVGGDGPSKPLSLEIKHEPSIRRSLPAISQGGFAGSPRRLSSPRRRFSGSLHPQYKNEFDLKLSEVSKELEYYISRQVFCSVVKEPGVELSPG